LEWFPRLRAISLAAEGEESEQNEIRSLQVQLETAQSLVSTLSRQLAELRDQVYMSSESITELLIQFQIIFFLIQMTEHRKQKQRIGLLNSAPAYFHLLSQ
jgi:hypothetical protein